MRIFNKKADELGLGISFNFRIKDQARNRNDKTSYRGSMNYTWLGYADDLALLAVTKELL